MSQFLHVDDIAETSLFVLELDKETYEANTQPMLSHINVGTGTDVSIMALAQMVGKVTGFEGKISNDPTKPNGTMRKLIDVSRVADMVWTAKVALREAVAETYQWFLDNQDAFRR